MSTRLFSRDAKTEERVRLGRRYAGGLARLEVGVLTAAEPAADRRAGPPALRHQRGFVLIGALVVALLYFALLELMLIEAVQAMRASQRFRARVVAQVLAENAAELVAHQLVFSSGKKVQIADEAGTMIAESRRLLNDQFEIEASGMITGAASQRATVAVFGRIQGTSVRVDRTIHSQ